VWINTICDGLQRHATMSVHERLNKNFTLALRSGLEMSADQHDRDGSRQAVTVRQFTREEVMYIAVSCLHCSAVTVYSHYMYIAVQLLV